MSTLQRSAILSGWTLHEGMPHLLQKCCNEKKKLHRKSSPVSAQKTPAHMSLDLLLAPAPPPPISMLIRSLAKVFVESAGVYFAGRWLLAPGPVNIEIRGDRGRRWKNRFCKKAFFSQTPVVSRLRNRTAILSGWTLHEGVPLLLQKCCIREVPAPLVRR